MTQFFAPLFAPSGGQPLAALRIVVGLALLIEAVAVFPFLSSLYGPLGYLQIALMDALSGPTVPGLANSMGISPESYDRYLNGFYIFHILAAFMLLIGFKTKYSSIAVWLTQTILINSGYLSSYGVDRYLQNIAFIFMWMPIGNCWSIDRWLSGRPVEKRSSCTVGLRFVQIFILATYVNAGVAKTFGKDWWTGNAIWEVLHMPGFHHFNFHWMADLPLIPKLLGWGTLVIESFYVFAVLIPKLRKPWVFAIIGLHLGIAMTMGLVLFGLTLAAINAALFLVPVDEQAHQRLHVQTRQTN